MKATSTFILTAFALGSLSMAGWAADLPVRPAPPTASTAPKALTPAAMPSTKFEGSVVHAPPPGPRPAPNPDINVYNPEDPACRVWTDGCRNCRRDQAGKVSCNNIGIACQPQAVTCYRN